jgi:hypothetical protein
VNHCESGVGKKGAVRQGNITFDLDAGLGGAAMRGPNVQSSTEFGTVVLLAFLSTRGELNDNPRFDIPRMESLVDLVLVVPPILG